MANELYSNESPLQRYARELGRIDNSGLSPLQKYAQSKNNTNSNSILQAAQANALANQKNSINTTEVNKGGIGGGVGYVASEAGLGFVRSLEGITDFLAAGAVELFGNDELADEIMKNDWMNYNSAKEKYNPNTAMGFVGDISSGIGGMIPSLALSLIPGAGPALSVGATAASAAGQGVSGTAKESGTAGGKEWAYGALTGAVEAAIEKVGGSALTGDAGKLLGKQVAKNAASKTAVSFVGEGLEEVASEILDPALKRVSGVDKNATVDWGALPRTFAVGGAVGGVMEGASTGINSALSGGYNNYQAGVRAQELSNALTESNTRQAEGKKTIYSEKDIDDAVQRLSKNLQKMDETTRTKYLDSNPFMRSYFAEDGTVLNNRQGSASTSRGAPTTYSASLRGRESTLAYAPSTRATTVSQDAMKMVSTLTKGKAEVVLTDHDFGTTADGHRINGEYRDGVIYLNAKATSAEQVNFVAAHELAHTLEGTKDYTVLGEYIEESIALNTKLAEKYNIAKYLKAYENSQDVALNEETKLYEATTEMYADFIANEVLSSQEAVNRLAKRDTNLVQRFLNWVRDALKRFSISKSNRAQYDELRRIEKALARALDSAKGGITLTEIDEAVSKAKEEKAKEAVAAKEAETETETKPEIVTEKKTEKKTESVKKKVTEKAQKGTVKTSTKETLSLKQAEREGIVDVKGGTVRYNLLTFEERGKDVLISNLQKNGFTQSEIQETVSTMEDMAEYFRMLEADVNGLIDWNSAKVVYDEKTGQSVFSAMVNNGDYPLNIDLSTICKKRVAITKVLNTLVRRNLIDSVSLSPENIVKINEILKANGYEVACPACFVETKRYRTEEWANQFTLVWNNIIQQVVKNPKSLDFVHGKYSVTVDDIDMKKLQNIIDTTEKRENRKIAETIRDNPQLRGLLSTADLIGSVGLKAIKQHAFPLYTRILNKAGSATPKIVQEVIPYNSELGGYKDLAKEAKTVGGVRMFSFSDFTVLQTFDYLQVIADLASQKATMHTYTKEIAFAELFGKTGIKINLSLIPEIDSSVGKENAGLDANGNLIWSKQWGVDYNKAKALMQKEGYNGNVGTATIGVSDNHILKLLDDPVTNYIIPYHESGINPIVKKQTKIDKYNDYTKVQSTRNADGKNLSTGEAKKFNFFKVLEQEQDARKMADKYLAWCKENNYIPKFEKFAFHKNYYKLLVDFQVYKTVNGEEVYAPQSEVTLTFPDNFKTILKAELLKQQAISDRNDAKFDETMQEIVKAISKNSESRKSITVTPQEDAEYMDAYYDGDDDLMQKLVDQVANRLGYKYKAYHHTENAFTEFDLEKARKNMDIQGFYFSADMDAESEYGSVRYDTYLKMENPYVVDSKETQNAIPFDMSKPNAGVIAREWLLSKGYDSVIRKAEYFGAAADEYIVLKPSQIKSAEAITYADDVNGEGDVIPLSQRFNPKKSDIRYSIDVNNTDANAKQVKKGKKYKLRKPTYMSDAEYQEYLDNVFEEGGDESVAEVTTVVTPDRKPTTEERIKAVKNKVADKWLDTKMRWTNIHAGIEEEAKRLGGNVEASVHKAKASRAAAINMLTNEQRDFSGKKRVGDSLAAIFKPIQMRGEQYAKDFNTYLYHMHNIDRMSFEANARAEISALLSSDAELAKLVKQKNLSEAERTNLLRKTENGRKYLALLDNKNKPVFGKTVTADDSKKAVAEMEAAHPEFKVYAKKVWDYSKNLIQYRVDAGLITKELADTLLKRYPHYVPTYRTDKNMSSSGISKTKKGLKVKETVKTAKGSNIDLEDISLALSYQTMDVVRAAAMNNLATELHDLAEKKGDFSNIALQENPVKLEEDMDFLNDRNAGEVLFYKDGMRYKMAVSQPIAEGFDAFFPASYSNDALANLLAKANTTFKGLVTQWNPLFGARNAIRDIQEALFYTKYGTPKFSAAMAKAYKQIIKKGEMYQRFLAAGGLEAGYFAKETGVYDKRNKGKKTIAKMSEKLQSLNAAVETAPRLAEFMLAIESGKTDAQALLESAEVTTNFSRGGKWSKMLNRTVMPFLNPSIQGWSKLWRTAAGKKTAKQWAHLIVKSIAVGMAVGMFNDLLNGDDEDYQKLNMRDKENYYIIRIGDGKFLKLPKGRVVAALGSIVTRTNAAMKGDEHAFEGWGESVLGMVTPVEQFSRTIFSPITDAKTNTTWYGSNIESESMQNYAVKDRYDEATSSIAIWIGQKLNYSPKKVHYLIDQYTGVIGDVLLPFTSEKAERGMFTSAFSIDSVSSNRISTEFYNMKDEMMYGKNAGDMYADMVYTYLNKVSTDVSEMYDEKRRIQNDSSLSYQKKIEQSNIVQELINDTLQAAMINAENFEQILMNMGYTDSLSVIINSNAYKNMDEDTQKKVARRFKTYSYQMAMSALTSAKAEKKYYLYDAVGAENVSIYLTEINDITADEDKKGNVTKTRKEKVHKYIESLKLSKEQKYILMYLAGYKPNEEGKAYVENYLRKSGFTAKELENLWE